MLALFLRVIHWPDCMESLRLDFLSWSSWSSVVFRIEFDCLLIDRLTNALRLTSFVITAYLATSRPCTFM